MLKKLKRRSKRLKRYKQRSVRFHQYKVDLAYSEYYKDAIF